MEGNKINYGLVFKEIRHRQKLYFIIIPLTFILSCVYIISIPRTYSSECVIIPEIEGTTSGGTSALNSLASTFGLDLSAMQSTDAITPLLYPELLDDNGFISKLFKIKVTSQDCAINTDYYTYLKKDQKAAWWNAGIGWFIKKFTKSDDEIVAKAFNPYDLSKGDSKIVETIKNNISFSVDKKTGAITICAKAQDPLISKTLVDSVRQYLQTFITTYRTNKAKNDMLYYEKLTREAKISYERSRQLYGSYADANTDIILESVHAKQNDLENDMQLKYNTYSSLSNQLQISKAKVQERTPVFTLIKGATVPVKAESPKRMIFVLTMSILAFIGTTLYILKDIIKEN